MRGDTSFAARCEHEATQLSMRIEENAWDGDWYRRAYFDDGTPLGSKSNTECQIDSISQSWSVLSGAGDAARSRRAMDAVYARLVRHEHALIQLLDPPFDKSDLDPGYIRGYVPGVRENGGQYTHAAIWTAMAFAALGDSRRAWELTSMINPVNHGRTAETAAIYKVEPYVVAADVYAVAPHTGRGGWTWYTGSAGWMYRLIVESLLGLKLEGDQVAHRSLPAGRVERIQAELSLPRNRIPHHGASALKKMKRTRSDQRDGRRRHARHRLHPAYRRSANRTRLKCACIRHP